MDAAQYNKMTAGLRKRPGAVRALQVANKVLTVVGYVAYPALLVVLAVGAQWPQLLRCVVVPAAAFVALSAFRKVYNAPRPYEALDIQPLIAKDTTGKSFPSRHAFSMFMIAVSWFVASPVVGAVLCAAGVFMACVRVVGGVHFPRDVAAGAAFAVAVGVVGYMLLPLP